MKIGQKLAVASAAAVLTAMQSCSCTSATAQDTPALKDLYADCFMVGAAVTPEQVTGEDSLGQETIKKHFNSIVAENCMKSERIHPEKNRYFWVSADSFVNFGEANNMQIVGHCLVWHSQLAKWFPYDDEGNFVCADTLKQRLADHINTVVGRYKGRVHIWDVVNEAILDDGSYRNSPFYQILGEEYIPLAFELAHNADPDAQLVINDYGMAGPAKRDAYVKIVNDLKSRGLRVDAIGMQSHIGMDYPDLSEFEKSIEAFAGTGCQVMVTEWEMSALPTVTTSANISETAEYNELLNPYPNGLPEDVDREWNNRMCEFMKVLIRHKDQISRFNAWGVCDGDSWKNGWPVPGRVDYPLLFDRNYELKPFATAALAQSETNKD